MITEKPGWVKHGGLQIFSIDIQPGGLRFATAGGDHKVRIWDMKYVSKDAELDQSAPLLLATLRDHFGSVNCVRWAKHGRYVASGSDDQVILIHERKPGTGTTEFGSGEPPDVENWKVVMTLRGHTADVVDINWSPDDSILASCSLDNTAHIWNMNNGICTAVLRGHSSLVKGISWDPIGSFLASQADDKTVIIWRTSDWSIEHRTEGHWGKSVGSTFFRRLGWSPCGHFITTTHGFQKPRHSAPVLERGDWSATFDFLGHNAPVVAVKFNHSMFRKTYANGSEPRVEPIGWSNGASEPAEREATTNSTAKESVPYNVIAIGSQDCTITVWTTSSPRPLFVAKHYFTQSVVDLSWSPDGYALFACSLDGTIATFHFEVKELGQRLTDAELDKLKRSRYGDVRGRQTNLAESPAQLLLEAASVEQSAAKKSAVIPDLNQTVKPSMDAEKTVTGQPHSKVSDAPVQDEKKNEVSSGVANSGGVLNKSATRTSPVKQREYRRPDGRKRIIPEAVGVPAHHDNISGISQGASLDGFFPVSDPKRDDNGAIPVDAGSKEVAFKRSSAGGFGTNDLAGGRSHRERSGVIARASITECLVLEKVPALDSNAGKIDIHRAGFVPTPNSQISKGIISIRVFDKKNGDDNAALCLEAKPIERVLNEIYGTGNTVTPKETEVTCSRGLSTLWSDRLPAEVTVLAGNANFWAVGMEDGCLQVYTKCGRRAMPTIMIGSSAIFVDCDDGWKLLLVTKKGLLYVWDIFSRICLVHDSLEPLFASKDNSSAKDAGSIRVISARFSRSGSPLVILATRQAFLFDLNLRCWVRVADDCFPASNFSSSLNLGQVGELAGLQVDIGKFLARKPGWNRTLTDDGVQTRAHLEAQLESSLILKSATEYRQCLLSYIRFLAREADESRLREVCETFLGPPVSMAESAVSQSPAWDPSVLGMKKHKLLRDDILPAMASSRKVQRLLNEFMDLLSEYESGTTETNTDQGKVGPLKNDA